MKIITVFHCFPYRLRCLYPFFKEKILDYFAKSTPLNACKVSAKIVESVVCTNPGILPRFLQSILNKDVLSISYSTEKMAFRIRLAAGACKQSGGVALTQELKGDLLQSIYNSQVLIVTCNVHKGCMYTYSMVWYGMHENFGFSFVIICMVNYPIGFLEALGKVYSEGKSKAGEEHAQVRHRLLSHVDSAASLRRTMSRSYQLFRSQKCSQKILS